MVAFFDKFFCHPLMRAKMCLQGSKHILNLKAVFTLEIKGIPKRRNDLIVGG